ncbi:hypothetical protein C7999DRAFT_41253 [Corynascus novoguineensis]|uniref:Uncharacterized protein n=1 Tax=Corynascus novoguineensis TaxID=1126955 RepID=A0AAN7CSH9_9PEZI|nr:hypothetical protein C7999DRAFT_41253 [Corynascus novoguineensis]
MFGRTNRVTPSHTTSGGTNRSISSRDASTRGSGPGHATHGSGAAPRQAASGSSSSTKSKTQGDKGKGSSSSSSTTKGHRSGGSSGGSSGSSSGGNGKKDKKDKKAEEELPEYQELYVIVFRGATYDSYNKRHCALLIKHLDAAGHVWRLNMIDIEGAERRWRVRQSVNRDPEGSAQFEAKVPVKSFMVGHGAQGQNDRRLRDSIYNAPINNENPEWNCQSWLEGALNRLKFAGFLTEEEA